MPRPANWRGRWPSPGSRRTCTPPARELRVSPSADVPTTTCTPDRTASGEQRGGTGAPAAHRETGPAASATPNRATRRLRAPGQRAAESACADSWLQFAQSGRPGFCPVVRIPGHRRRVKEHCAVRRRTVSRLSVDGEASLRRRRGTIPVIGSARSTSAHPAPARSAARPRPPAGPAAVPGAKRSAASSRSGTQTRSVALYAQQIACSGSRCSLANGCTAACSSSR